MNCPNCQTSIPDNAKLCGACGTTISQPEPQFAYATPTGEATYQTAYQAGAIATQGTKNKLVASLLAIFLGALGIHKFYLGYTKAGVIMLLVTIIAGIFTLGAGACIMGIVALIEGILYLTKSEEQFRQIYEIGEKQWF